MTGRIRRTLVATVATFTALALPAVASAADRYVSASPANPTNVECTEANPCALEHAIENVALDGETVFVRPGIYDQNGPDDLLQGAAPSENIEVVASNPVRRTAVQVQNGASWIVAGGSRVTDMDLIGTAVSGPALDVVGEAADTGTPSTARRVVVDGVAGDAARVGPDALITDSLLFGSGRGLLAEGAGVATARNVTAVSTNPNPSSVGLLAHLGSDLKAVNVIARASGTDVQADGADIEFTHSNFSAARVVESNGGTTIGDAGTQSTPELTNNADVFRDFPGQDYRLRNGSPAIDAGALPPPPPTSRATLASSALVWTSAPTST